MHDTQQEACGGVVIAIIVVIYSAVVSKEMLCRNTKVLHDAASCLGFCQVLNFKLVKKLMFCPEDPASGLWSITSDTRRTFPGCWAD